MGMVGRKQWLHAKVWWKSIEKVVEKWIKKCHGCQVVGMAVHLKPMK
jgi:hypothetical protein